jgi:hypothetical protein
MTDCLLNLCAHRAADGSHCHAPALRQSEYCRHHVRVHRPRVPDWALAANTPRELQLALYRVMTGIATGHMDHKESGPILHELSKRIYALNPKKPKRGSPKGAPPSSLLLA